jgi:hypothetical protein
LSRSRRLGHVCGGLWGHARIEDNVRPSPEIVGVDQKRKESDTEINRREVVDIPEGSADVEFWASMCLPSRQNHRFRKADEDPVDSGS